MDLNSLFKNINEYAARIKTASVPYKCTMCGHIGSCKETNDGWYCSECDYSYPESNKEVIHTEEIIKPKLTHEDWAERNARLAKQLLEALDLK